MIPKKRVTLILLLCILFLSQIVQAQENTIYGAKLGVNVATVGGDAEGVQGRLGFVGGLYLISKLSDHVSLQPEIVYSQQGATEIAGNDVIKYDYIHFPIALKVSPAKGFYVQFGPQFGFQINSKIDTGDETLDINNGEVVEISAFGGIGFDFGPAELSVKYNVAFTSTVEGGRGDAKFPNRVFQVAVSIPFNSNP